MNLIAFIYILLLVITLLTATITYVTYKNGNNLFKFWLVLLIFNVVIIVVLTIITIFFNPFNQMDINLTDSNEYNQQEDNENKLQEDQDNINSDEIIGQGNNQDEPHRQSSNIYIFLLIALVFALNSLLAIFVYRDAGARAGVFGALPWAIIVFLTSIIGLGIYLLVRPVGNVIICNNCKKLRLDTIPYCPHCYEKLELPKDEDK
ncbi:hypothetical protein [Desulfuribacillus alkaliarsenatis]|uniref:Zinc ribbon domain-containing protein n=1 Tax=Desulfuribacillus alkaliarsenatis TaxID=766136 RepID=A0A1E5FZL2_9FIRM|nr:hypothetical protein [Desulfuribacillus alkaliarsenatis]OEF96017.1 hypothetical protein BHF68_09730 [Desulfuribacillus alkaliarsenatis]